MKNDKNVKIAWYGKHFGEEPPLTGKKSEGAGGIFFTGCHLHCVFCQNYQISQQNLGKDYSVKELAEIMLKLQNDNAVNIDLVTPTLYFAQIKEAVLEAKKRGLKIPIVWNSNGFESVEMIKKLKGIVDIYLPDFKYGIEEIGYKYSKVKKYPQIAEKAIKEMFAQVGPLEIKNNIAVKGIIVRHMVLPNNLENSLKVLEILSPIKKNIHISLMSQYLPTFKAKNYPEINRKLSKKEWDKVCDKLYELKFTNGWIQDRESSKTLIPDFTKNNPF
jgi:putative pyruvate formate lyase activating enzyme